MSAHRFFHSVAGFLLVLLFSGYVSAAPGPEVPLETGWTNPPTSARLRAYWWWLNGNVTKESITHDLEEMKAKGFGGALICDAGGAEQDGNSPVPHGPTFFTPAWRELYKHALHEANRLGLEMSLNILSGWNLGGPMVTADDAAKKLVWSEARANGPTNLTLALPKPQTTDNYFRDSFVVAYRLKPAQQSTNICTGLTASSAQAGHPAAAAADGDPSTFWVSDGSQAGQGPSQAHPQWLQIDFTEPVSADHLLLQGRPEYGPRECQLLVSTNGTDFESLTAFGMPSSGKVTIAFGRTTARAFRVLILNAYDPLSREAPRNVQVAELQLSGPQGTWPAPTQRPRPLMHFEEKAVYKTLHFSAPDTSSLFEEYPSQPGEEDTHSAIVLNLTARFGADGVLRWNVPAGEWQILRFGCTVGNNAHVSTSSDGWKGYALDVLDAGAFQRYWDAVVEPLIADAGPLVGTTLKYLHTDSWEVEAINWTPTLPEEFRQRRGYDLVPFLPVLAGRIVDNRRVSDRFLADFRKTLGDLAIAHHFQLFRDNAHKHGLQIHPESGGPHAVPIDAQRCLGWDDAPMSEFWAWSWRHRIGDENRFFVKQPASAAHTYGHPLVVAEGFTDMGPHWQESLWENLKPSFDKALCEGLNLLVWHAFVCSPKEMGVPGQQYFAGTHFNPNTTWWPQSGAFLSYIDRCQFLMQQGLFDADVCYYYGDHVPNFAQLKSSDPAHVLPGFDYDVITEEALLNLMSFRDGRLRLPDGMSYRLLVLPERSVLSLPVLRKLRELVVAGATVLGPRPDQASGLTDYPVSDVELAEIADELWGPATANPTKNPLIHQFRSGRVISGLSARHVLLTDGVAPDFAWAPADAPAGSPATAPTWPGRTNLDYMHRTAGDAEIYFVANRSNGWLKARCTFRVADKAPELWDPVSGQHSFAAAYATSAAGANVSGAAASALKSQPVTTPCTTVPLEFPPYGSWFVVFRSPAASHPAAASSNAPKFTRVNELTGPWTVRFDPKWGGPESTRFDQLVSWTARPESGIKYYSGTATYQKEFDCPAARPGARHLWLDLGKVRELAQVRLNGHDLGVVWSPPFRVDISGVVQPTNNRLELQVVNFWPNRIIGDQLVAPDKRFTRTNIRRLTKETPLMESGLFGPVQLLEQK